MIRLANFQLNNDWSNTISINNCVICHSQQFDGQQSRYTYESYKPEYKNSEFIFKQLIRTLEGITRYNLSTLISKMYIRLNDPYKHKQRGAQQP